MGRSWFSRLIWKGLRRERRKKKLYKDLAAYYLNVWITYARELLNHLEVLPQGKFVVIDYNLLNCSDKETFSILTNQWKFSLQYFDFKKVFKEKFISKVVDINNFIIDKSLLKTARDLENELKEYV
jgi:hypothetical protein